MTTLKNRLLLSLDELKEKIKAENLLLSSLRGEKEQALQLIKQSSWDVQKDQKRRKVLKKEEKELRNNISSLEAIYSGLQKSYEKEKGNLKEDIVSLQEELDALESVKSKFQDYTAQNEQLLEERQSLEAELSEIKIKNTAQEAHKLSLEKEIEALDIRKAEAEKKLEAEIKLTQEQKRQQDDRQKNLTLWSIQLNKKALWVGKMVTQQASKTSGSQMHRRQTGRY